MKTFPLKFLFGFLALSQELYYHSVTSSKCDRIPPEHTANKSPSDGRYKLRILGDPDPNQGYVAGENYTSELYVKTILMHIVKKDICGVYVVYTERQRNESCFTSKAEIYEN